MPNDMPSLELPAETKREAVFCEPIPKKEAPAAYNRGRRGALKNRYFMTFKLSAARY